MFLSQVFYLLLRLLEPSLKDGKLLPQKCIFLLDSLVAFRDCPQLFLSFSSLLHELFLLEPLLLYFNLDISNFVPLGLCTSLLPRCFILCLLAQPEFLAASACP